WTRRDEYAHWRRNRDDQSATSIAAAGRYLRAPQRCAGAAATRVGAFTGHLRQRCVQASVALLGSDQSTRPITDGAAASDAGADRSGGDRGGDAVFAARRADRGI